MSLSINLSRELNILLIQAGISKPGNLLFQTVSRGKIVLECNKHKPHIGTCTAYTIVFKLTHAKYKDLVFGSIAVRVPYPVIFE